MSPCQNHGSMMESTEYMRMGMGRMPMMPMMIIGTIILIVFAVLILKRVQSRALNVHQTESIQSAPRIVTTERQPPQFCPNCGKVMSQLMRDLLVKNQTMYCEWCGYRYS